MSAPLNAGALSEWAVFEAGFLPGLAPLHERLVRAPPGDARHRHDHSWRLPDKLFPYSCTDEEGLAMARVIQANGLRRGFEIATAFGFSSAYLGLALKAAGGRLVSLDCYVEEWKESFEYDDAELAAATAEIRRKVAAGELPSGLRFARQSAELLELSGVVDYEIGLSPQDVGSILGERTLDLAFIDGGHFGDQPLRDFKAIEPRLEARCAVFFHDNNHNPSVA
jgi:predicted O-methyltransferase YrrM